MARTVASLPAGSRITGYISLGIIAKFFPLDTIHVVLAESGRASVPQRDLPAHVVVYYVIALALYMGSSTREALRCLLVAGQWLMDPSVKVKVAGAEAIHRRMTTILDPGRAPARELAAPYYERWQIETAFDELKTHLGGAPNVLRGKTPELVQPGDPPWAVSGP